MTTDRSAYVYVGLAGETAPGRSYVVIPIGTQVPGRAVNH
jgi:hypothetical protein